MPSTPLPDVTAEDRRRMCCSGRRAFLGWLLVWLCLSVARQCFDLLGKLWSLLCIDLTQILAICSALSTLLRRPSHHHDGRCNLVFMATFSFVSLILNIILFLWWCTELFVGSGQRERLLAFGLPFGHSFFVRHSPFCSAYFNLTTHRWEQPVDCVLSFSFFEGLQAILHAIFAAGTFILAIFLFAKKRKNNDRNEENPWEIEEKSAVKKNGMERNGETQTHYSGYNLMDKENYTSNGRETVASGYMGSLFEQRGASEEPTHLFSSSTTNNDKKEEQQRNPILQQRIAPIPPIRRSLPRRMEQQQNKLRASRQRGNVGSSQRRAAIIGNKKTPSAPIDNTTNYSSLSTVAAAECRATIAAASNNGPGEFLTLIAAANSISSRSSCSSNSFSTQQNRHHLQQMPPTQNPPPLSAFGTNAVGLDRPIKGGGATSLMVSFDPKASGSELIQVRAHRRTSASSDEEEREKETLQGGRQNCYDERREEEQMDGIKIENDGNNVVKEEQFTEDDDGLTAEFGLATSLQSIPSMEAPSLLDASPSAKMPIGFTLPSSASILSHPLPPLPIIRHRVPPHFVDEISQNLSDYVPSIGLLSRPLLPPSSSMVESNIADGGLSIYETFLGSGPQDACTSFPVKCGAAPRQSAVQLAAVSAMRLSNHDLLAADFDHKNEEEIAKNTQKVTAEAPPQITTQMGMRGMLV